MTGQLILNNFPISKMVLKHRVPKATHVTVSQDLQLDLL